MAFINLDEETGKSMRLIEEVQYKMVKKKKHPKICTSADNDNAGDGNNSMWNRGRAIADLSAMGAVTAVSREEGSGTRAEFENLLKLPESDTGIVVDSTEKVLKKVEEDKNAVGYVAYRLHNGN